MVQYAKYRAGQAWSDLRIEPVARTTGTNAPTFEQWFDDSGLGDTGTSRGVYLYSFDDAASNAEKEVFFNLQMDHDWNQDDFEVHIHWIPSVADTTASPRWCIEYTWIEPGGTFGATTTTCAVGNVQGDANLTAGKHYITEILNLNPGATQDGLSTILIGRLYRNSGDAADTYDAAGNKCGLLYIDAHYIRNSVGSITEYTK
jgi:hypothetical protein